MYFLNYVDRNAIAQARLNGLEDDLGMSGVEFNTCVSMLVLPVFTSDIGIFLQAFTDYRPVSSLAMFSCRSHRTCLLLA